MREQQIHLTQEKQPKNYTAIGHPVQLDYRHWNAQDQQETNI